MLIAWGLRPSFVAAFCGVGLDVGVDLELDGGVGHGLESVDPVAGRKYVLFSLVQKSMKSLAEAIVPQPSSMSRRRWAKVAGRIAVRLMQAMVVKRRRAPSVPRMVWMVGASPGGNGWWIPVGEHRSESL